MDDPEQKSDRSGEQKASAAPSISLPKGGGAIRGIGEKFAANPVTGTGSLTVPIYASPGRSGFGPQLALSYDSGAANGSFGFGWNLSLPAITRKTDKGLPQYQDAVESDIFILSGAEDLVPSLVNSNGAWVREVLPTRTIYGKQYTIHRYRPRVEGLFARIERWVNDSDLTDTFWRSITKDNITTWYGRTSNSRIADPSDPSRIFNWLICETSDDKGNVMAYQYKAEDSSGVDLSQSNERNRNDLSRSAQRYIKYIFYGNRTPYFPDLNAAAPVAQPSDWCFQLVFDYGDHDLAVPIPQDTAQPWLCRPDPFSSYRSGFEVRTYRLCRRVLMFHHFANEPNVGVDCLVRSTDLIHASSPPVDPTQTFYSYLLSATQTGYVRQGNGYLARSLPPLEFEYTEAVIDETVRDVDPDSLRNLPEGLAGSNYRWVDLDGEGLSGILTEQGGGWYYKPNLSPANQQSIGGENLTLPRFGPLEQVMRQPSTANLNSGNVQLMDLSGDGMLDVVEFSGPCPGYFERTFEGDWQPFRVFRSLPVVNWRDPNLKFVDLTGDGFPDLLISEDTALWWQPSLSVEGFGPALRVPQALDEEKGPKFIFADGTETIFLADMSGDGLSDLVRVRNGEVCYWPNLGYGRFGAKVTMKGSPRLDRPDLFNARRIRLADIDGSGTADIIYFASDAINLYFNQSGNGWGAQRNLSHFPAVESVSSATVIDLLGNGTACLVWSSPLPGNAARPMRYIDLLGGHKPHLLVRSRNNLGAETVVSYAPSTKFYVTDKLSGTPWLTRLPFPVHVVERVETYNHISNNRFSTRYAYHHGYYDGVEREFRGFGMVEQWDTEAFTALSQNDSFMTAANIDASSHVPPVYTKTWFHTGAYFGEARVSRHFEDEYYDEGDASDAIAGLTLSQKESMLLDDTVLPTTVMLPDGSRIPFDPSPEELREACRALRGSILRLEVYGLDGSDRQDRPYSASERNYTIEVLQPQEPNRYGVFLAHARETIDFHYERMLYKVQGNNLADPGSTAPGVLDAADPRVTHAITLAVDSYGNVLRSAAIGYGRRYQDPALTAADQIKQSSLLCTYSENSFTNAILDDDSYRTPQPSQSSTYELLQLQPVANQPHLTNLFRLDELQSKIQSAADGAHDIPYENFNPTGLSAGQPYRRLIERARTLYRKDDLSVLLPSGALETLAMPGERYKLAYTPGLLNQIYQRNGVELLGGKPEDILAGGGGDHGGYVDLDNDKHWWIPTGRAYLSPGSSDDAPTELAYARQHFFQPCRYRDPYYTGTWNTETSVSYDAYNLFPIQTIDAVGNTVSAAYDYRALQPQTVTDPNGNRSQVAFDALGLVVASAIMGKVAPAKVEGDLLEGFDPDPPLAALQQFLADPLGRAAGLLGEASTRVVYDLDRYQRCGEPPFAATLAREIHVADPGGDAARIQVGFSYSDGFGRDIQKKIQAEPGDAPQRNANQTTSSGDIAPGALVLNAGQPVMAAANPRWVGNGRTVYNNKGKPVKQYEPFFSSTHLYESERELTDTGVSPILFYDPAERVIATLHPNNTYEKVVFDPWQQTTFDVNDTAAPNGSQTGDPRTDPNIEDYVAAYFKTQPPTWQTWYQQRVSGALGADEQAAATRTSMHANTPSIAHTDALGRTVLTIARNRYKFSDAPASDPPQEAFYATRVDLDIEGNQRQVFDANERIVMQYSYSMIKSEKDKNGKTKNTNLIHQASMEAGERWMLNDVTGKPLYGWNSRLYQLRSEYDLLRRPVKSFVQGGDPAEKNATVYTNAILVGLTIYGDDTAGTGMSAAQLATANLRGKAYKHFDSAGIVTTDLYDFKGNSLQGSREVANDYKNIIDWNAKQPPGELFASSMTFDALNRPVTVTSPDKSVYRPTFNETNLLYKVDVNLQGAANATSFVANIDYNAKDQRTQIQYGNGTSSYTYDPLTFRLTQLITRRNAAAYPDDCPQPPPTGWPGCQVQNLNYTYDPAGNITHIRDDAQQTVYFRNKRVEPSNDYTYDAIYRLIEATGREHLGQVGGTPIPHSYNDAPRVGLAHPGDGNALGLYLEQYQYDPVGNFLRFIHRGSDPANPGWKRDYAYQEASLLETGKFSNRPTSTTIGSTTETYSDLGKGYDAHGSMLSMPQLQAMRWNFKDEMCLSQRQAVNASDADGTLHQGETTYYIYDAAGQRLRKVTERQNGTRMKERIYLGGYEVYREYDGQGINVTLERQTLHVMDDKQRIALVETKTVNTANDDSPAQLVRYQLGNHLGSASLELDDQGKVISYEEYTPYGSTSYQAVDKSIKAAAKRYRYTGKERDEETGFTYHGARYYAAWLGRWTACDPKEMVDGANLYAYVRNNPVKLLDPRGMQSTSQTSMPRLQLQEPELLHSRTAEERLMARVESSISPGLGLTSPGSHSVQDDLVSVSASSAGVPASLLPTYTQMQQLGLLGPPPSPLWGSSSPLGPPQAPSGYPLTSILLGRAQVQNYGSATLGLSLKVDKTILKTSLVSSVYQTTVLGGSVGRGVVDAGSPSLTVNATASTSVKLVPLPPTVSVYGSINIVRFRPTPWDALAFQLRVTESAPFPTLASTSIGGGLTYEHLFNPNFGFVASVIAAQLLDGPVNFTVNAQAGVRVHDSSTNGTWTLSAGVIPGALGSPTGGGIGINVVGTF